MVIQQFGVQQNWKMAHTFLVLEIGNIVMKTAQYIPMVRFYQTYYILVQRVILKILYSKS